MGREQAEAGDGAAEAVPDGFLLGLLLLHRFGTRRIDRSALLHRVAGLEALHRLRHRLPALQRCGLLLPWRRHHLREVHRGGFEGGCLRVVIDHLRLPGLAADIVGVNDLLEDLSLEIGRLHLLDAVELVKNDPRACHEVVAAVIHIALRGLAEVVHEVMLAHLQRPVRVVSPLLHLMDIHVEHDVRVRIVLVVVGACHDARFAGRRGCGRRGGSSKQENRKNGGA